MLLILDTVMFVTVNLNFICISEVEDKNWHYEGGVPCSKKVVGDVILKTWGTCVGQKGKFSIAQIALTVTEVS